MKDSKGVNLNVGDVVSHVDGYDLIVKYSKRYGWYGKLVCDKSHSCRNIPYALNSECVTLKTRKINGKKTRT